MTTTTDYYLIDELLTEEEREIRHRVRTMVDEKVLPTISDYWANAKPPLDLLPELARLNLSGGAIKGYGCPGISQTAAGLVAMELTRGDGGLWILFGGTSTIAMTTMDMLGSEEQKRRWLPPMAKLEKLGAFALTEPNHGSDAVMLETKARRDKDEWILDGEKRWIGNASFADVAIVWARDEERNVGGFLVEKGTPGYSVELIEGKTAVRSAWHANIKLDGVRIPIENRLENARSFRDTARVLTATRADVAWGAIGPAIACYERAVAYVQERKQFGRPLAKSPIIQSKLAGMLAEVTTMQLMCLRLSQLLAEGKMTDGMASLAKMNNARKARQICLEARDMLGGNGILLENHVARYVADIEAVYTYEGTDTVQSLIVGSDITGMSAFF